MSAKILILDDDASERKRLTSLFSAEDYHVIAMPSIEDIFTTLEDKMFR